MPLHHPRDARRRMAGACSGQALAEFALVTVTFCTLLFGLLDLTFLLYAREAAVAVAQEAARVAAAEGRSVEEAQEHGQSLLSTMLGARAARFQLSLECPAVAGGVCIAPTVTAQVAGSYAFQLLGAGVIAVPVAVRVTLLTEHFRPGYAALVAPLHL